MGLDPDRTVVNLQGDEPLMPHEILNQVANLFVSKPDASVSTAAHRVVDANDLRNPNVVKVVCSNNGDALYFLDLVFRTLEIFKSVNRIGI